MAITTTVHDGDIPRYVQQELEWDPRVESTNIAVMVKDGIVTLTGTVDSYARKLAAVDATHRVRGVLDVVDELHVGARIHVKSDQDLAKAVRLALIWDVYVPDERIRSTVSDGWVTLEGNVDCWQQREDACRAVARLRDVRGVTSRIETQPLEVDAGEIRASIEDALTRRAKREARRLQVMVADGVVTLKGLVDSWAEKNAVGQLASQTRGVKRIVNEIAIDAYS